MDKTKKWMAAMAFLLFLTLAGFSFYNWLSSGTIDAGGIFFSFIALTYFFNCLAWGQHEGGGEKDELARHIETQSTKIGYYVLMALAGLILFISEGTGNFNEIDNYPLLLVVCLTFVTVPITEYIYSRKYKVK
ncbi:hypothetical protein [Jeotgalibacillus campisalis]|uniref:Uncharacterized protein n=1 Tax=Jeotgalibacillus campisalis TaxID=220754 RepID=A0A0C2VGH8_9BACL|nr:hypothetical protein [Jeotgalibacillus campisalis]KIL43093.1 hypothetical protein KR50_34960 [Jeotgalibacillus campisalis]